MPIRATVTALACAAGLLLTGCDLDQAKDEKMSALFNELLRRPDIEQMQSRYLRMLEQIRQRLVQDIGIEAFQPDDDEPVSGSACPGDYAAVSEAEVRRFRSGKSPGAIPDGDWPRALDTVTDVAAREGFDRVEIVVDKPRDHEVAITDGYGAELIFGTARNTILSLSTGCHLSHQAHQRGTPDDAPLY